jgi:uncharacterized UBP type Zn finger protein
MQLRALESLGVTIDKYAAIFYPLEESALPDKVMKAWDRSHISQSGSQVHQSNYLKALLHFFKQDVESEEHLLVAHTSFSSGGGTTSTQT